jgi:hypothetical protein
MSAMTDGVTGGAPRDFGVCRFGPALIGLSITTKKSEFLRYVSIIHYQFFFFLFMQVLDAL